MFFTIIPDPCRSHLQEAEDIADDVVITVQQNHDQSQAAAYIVKCRNNEGKIAEKAFVKESVPAFTQAPQQKDSMVQSLLSRAGTFVAEKRTMIQLPQNPKKKKILVISIVAILVIAGMMIWGNIRSSQRDTRVNAALAPVHQLLDSAKTKQSTDLPTARTLAKQAIESAKEKTSMYKQKSYEWRKASALAEDAQSYYDSISGEKHVSFPVFYNLQLVKQSFIGKRMAIAGDAIVFLDPEENAAISVKIENKQSSVLNTTGVSESRAITALDKHIYILGDGVYEDGKVVIQKSDAWQDPAFINAFGSNIYVLDRGVRALSKYAGSDGTFSSNPTNWIKSAAGLDFSLVNSVAIDGKVWITTKKGEIFAFAQGTKTPFSVKNLSLQFTQPIVLYTAESLSHLYILDPANNRVVMLDKNGEYQKQWIGAEVGTATDVVVSPDEKTAFFSSGSVVYSLNLE